MDSLPAKILACCLGGRPDGHLPEAPFFLIVNEKPRPGPTLQSPLIRTADATALEIVRVLLEAEKNGKALARDLDGIASTAGWNEWLAEKVLKKLEAAIAEGGEKIGPAMREALDKVHAVAEQMFTALVKTAKEHPLELAAAVLLTIIAIGVLAEMAPLFIELLGFGELGPIQGSFAAWWESTYGGYIPAGSIFSFLQRLGMSFAK